MNEKVVPSPYFPLLAAGFEAGLALLAVVLGWLFGQAPWEVILLNRRAIGGGAAAVLPLLGLLILTRQLRWSTVQAVWRVLDEIVAPMFRTCNWVELAAISLLAGMGEELLFRGLLQSALAEWSADFLPHTQAGALTGDWLAVVAAAIVFGALHAVNMPYAVLATLMGVYLGWLFLATGNLAVPMIAHGLYDFIALAYIVRRFSASDRTDGV